MSKGGRPKKVWDEEDIRTFKGMCSVFCTEDEICRVMGVSDKTLVELINRYLYEEITGHKLRGKAKKIGFSEAFKKYSANGKASLRRAQYEEAVHRHNTSMMIWLGKQYLDQTDTPQVEVNNAPVISWGV